MALYSRTYGTRPAPEEWRQIWAINVPSDAYTITHGTPFSTADPCRPGAGEYSSMELYALVQNLITIWESVDTELDSVVHESAGNWASSILETLGFEWV